MNSETNFTKSKTKTVRLVRHQEELFLKVTPEMTLCS